MEAHLNFRGLAARFVHCFISVLSGIDGILRLVVGYQNAVQMVHFMLHHAGPESINAVPLGATVHIETLHLDLEVPFDIHLHPWQAQTPFGHLVRPLATDKDRVGQAYRTSSDLRDEESLGNAHLRGGQANPIVDPHQQKHFVHHIRQPLIEPLHWIAYGAQDRVRMQPQV
jgi:hypothetical protein